MKNTYNKGKYRNFEYAKHLRPFLKRVGNKKWRSGENLVIKEEISLEQTEENGFVGKSKKKSDSSSAIKVKITCKGFNDVTFSRYKKYKTERALNDSSKRNSVLRIVLK